LARELEGATNFDMSELETLTNLRPCFGKVYDRPQNSSNYYGAFTLDVKSVLNENLGGILGGTQC
jgi:hypothetical protein